MACAGAKGKRGFAAEAAHAPQHVHPLLASLHTGFGMKSRALRADFTHVAQDQPTWGLKTCQHLDGSSHRIGVGVVAVVHQGETLVGMGYALHG